MPDNIKYISKIHVGEDYYYIKDTSSVHETSVDSTPVFKDADGKYWNLSKTQQGAVTLSEYVYNAPTASFVSGTVKWGTSNLSVSSNGKTATITGEVDSHGGTSTYTNVMTGSIDHDNTSTCSSSAASFTSYVNPSTEYYDFSVPVTVNNNTSNGLTAVTITCTGSQSIPGTNDKESVSLTATVAMNTTKSYAYALSTSQNAISAKGTLLHFDFNVADPVQVNSNTFTEISNLNAQDITIPNTDSPVYLYIISAVNKEGKMFIMKADKNTVGGATTPSGSTTTNTTSNPNSNVVKAYSIGKDYYVYRSTDTFTTGDKVAFKAN